MRLGTCLFSTAVLLVSALTIPALADSIRIDGQVYENVYVREGNAVYFVQTPTDGKVLSIPKERVVPNDIVLTPDPAQRKAILEAWKAQNVKLRGIQPSEPQSVPLRQPAQPTQNTDVSTSEPRKLVLKNVTVRDVLDVATRMEGLDYSVQDGYILIDTPERLRLLPPAAPETRAYSLSSPNDTLPKALVANRTYSQTVGMGYGSTGNTASTSRYGTGYASGVMGGYGQGGYSAGAYQRGGYGGAGMGYGGYGGYGGSYGPHFSNISDLFTTIDDRLVGEPLAQIYDQSSRRVSR